MELSPDFAKLENLEKAVQEAPLGAEEFWNICRIASVFVQSEAKKREGATLWGVPVKDQLGQLQERTRWLNQEGNFRPEEARNQALGSLRFLRALWEGAVGPE